METRNQLRIGLGPALYRTETEVSRFQQFADPERIEATLDESDVGLLAR